MGVASVFRRAMWIDGRVELTGQVGDFAIDTSHRSLGPAVLLQRATFAPVDAGEATLCYDCPPHDRGMSTFRRLGMTVNATMDRYARLLRTSRQLNKRVGSVLGASLSPLGDIALRLMGHRVPGAVGLEVCVYEGRFDEEFSALDRRVATKGAIRGRRAAEDLNWRYREDPLTTYRVLVARRKGELLGFSVLSVADGDGLIIDLFGALTPEEELNLLDSTAGHASDLGAETLHALVSGSHALGPCSRGPAFDSAHGGPTWSLASELLARCALCWTIKRPGC